MVTTYMVIGGVYGNLQALDAAFAAARAHRIPAKHIICTGDLVAYCGQPNEVLQKIRELGITSIQGNVEEQLLAQSDQCGCGFVPGSVCDRLSGQWFEFLRNELTSENLAWIAKLPKHLDLRWGSAQVQVIHGSYREIAGYVFPSTPWEMKASELRAAQADIILAGHCGIPFMNSAEGKVWANSGALGMPANDGTSRVWLMFVTVDASGIEFKIEPLNYEFEMTRAEMRKRSLPIEYIETLKSGIWPSCEILPESEALKQGQPLQPAHLTYKFPPIVRV